MAEYTIKESLEIVSNYIGSKVKDREPIFRINVIPEASSAYNGKIIQYLGRTTEYYIRGYFYKCTLLDDEYVWLRHDVQPNMSEGIVVSIPTISVGEYTYNGEEQGPTFLGLDPGRCTITNQKSIDAGHHTMSIALKDTSNMEWADGSTSPKTYDYDIGKISQTISTDETDITLMSGIPPVSIEINGANGSLSAISSDESIVAATVNENYVTFSSTGINGGNVTVLIKANESTNYDESNVISISVTAEALKIGSFGSLSDLELVALVKASDSGAIDLAEDAGWKVGDERNVQLSAIDAGGLTKSQPAQVVTFVLMDKNGYELSEEFENKTNASFIVGIKSPLKNWENMGPSGQSNTWKQCSMRQWCNSLFRGAVPSSIREIFKQVKVKSAKNYSGSEIEETNDYFFLPSAKEFFGTQGNSTAIEANSLSQWSWYTNSSNRTANIWTRSTMFNNSSRFCMIGPWKSQDDTINKDVRGVIVCGCI